MALRTHATKKPAPERSIGTPVSEVFKDPKHPLHSWTDEQRDFLFQAIGNAYNEGWAAHELYVRGGERFHFDGCTFLDGDACTCVQIERAFPEAAVSA